MGECQQCRMEAPNHKMDCSFRGAKAVSNPETKVVLGRTFTHFPVAEDVCYRAVVKYENDTGVLFIFSRADGQFHCASLYPGRSPTPINATGPTEADAILALQSQLRKMAELEVES